MKTGTGAVRTACGLYALLLLCGCGVLGPAAEGASRIHIDGQAYEVAQLTEGTWTVMAVKTGAGALPAAQTGRDRKNRLIAAVETASGCKVTDSDFAQQGIQFDAQVDCRGRLK